MNKKSDTLQKFESSLQELEAQPSAEAWSKLEKKLRPKKHVQRFRLLRITSVAAAFLLLISLSLGYLFLSDTSPRQFASNHVKPVDIEPIEMEEQLDLKQNLRLARKYFNQSPIPILEGNADGLRSKSNVGSHKRSSPSMTTATLPDLSSFMGVWKSTTGPVKMKDDWTMKDQDVCSIKRELSSINGTSSLAYHLSYLSKENHFVLQRNDYDKDGIIMNWQTTPLGESDLQYRLFQDDIHMLFNLNTDTYLTNFYLNGNGQIIKLEENVLFRREE